MVFVKICGLTNAADALLAVALGADALGFVFAPSPREVTPRRVAGILGEIPSGILTFGVFVNEHPSRVCEIVHEVGLLGAQLHGTETPSQVAAVVDQVRYVIKGVSAGGRLFDRVDEYTVWATLLDSPSPGSGKVFDWAVVDGLRPTARIILAGGLDADNVAAAIRAVNPFGVDVSSGVESEPGRKDPIALRRFISVAKSSGRETRSQGSSDQNDERIKEEW